MACHACALPDLSAWNDVDAVDSSEDCRRQLGPEGIPHAVFDLRRRAVLAGGSFDRNKLLTVDSLSQSNHSMHAQNRKQGCQVLIKI